MSINSLASTPWSNPWATSVSAQSETEMLWSAAPTDTTGPIQGGFDGPWSGQGAGGTSNTATSPANPLQSLAADIQAMLIQTQGAGATSGAAASGTNGTSATSPEQQAVTDLETLMNQLQSATSPNAQTANANPSGAAGRTEHHHHHHHHDGDGEASGATGVASSSASSATTSGDGQAVSQVFAAGVAQAVQAYGGTSDAAAMFALTM